MLVVAAAVLLGALRPADDPPPTHAPAIAGLDHIPIAVANLDEAAARYRALGFTLKPGRFHDNGIRNEHAKFADGTELELITAPEARDPLTSQYRRHLANGDGPAFLSFYAPVIEKAASRLAPARTGDTRRGSFLYLGDQDGLGYLFLGPRNASPTDRPEHFVHANGASSLVRVWLAGDLSAERRLLETLGARVAREEVRVPGRTSALVAHLDEGDVVLLPAERQLVAGRKIVGATLRVRTLAPLEGVLAQHKAPAPERVATGQGASLFLAPDRTHGLWLEFRESP